MISASSLFELATQPWLRPSPAAPGMKSAPNSITFGGVRITTVAVASKYDESRNGTMLAGSRSGRLTSRMTSFRRRRKSRIIRGSNSPAADSSAQPSRSV